MLDTMLDQPFVPPVIRGLRRVEYAKLMEAGLITKEDRCELLEGQLVVRPKMQAPHAALTMRLGKVLRAPAERKGLDVRMNLPFAATDDSEPEPDLALVDEAEAMSMHGHPQKPLLLIEVCHSADYNDRVIKTRIYARAKVPEYWIVDVNDKTIEVYTTPRARSYGNKRLVTEGVVAPIALPDARVDLAKLFADY